MTILCKGLHQLDEVASKIISFCKGEMIWVFQGDMGAGKTTLIKSIARALDMVDTVSSPTYSIVNEYRNTKGEIFYHFDFYRIKDQMEALEIGVEEYFYSGNLCWLEWAEKIPDFIPSDLVRIDIEVREDDSRMISLTKVTNGKKHG